MPRIVAKHFACARMQDHFALNLVADDDLYWLDPEAPTEWETVGLNTFVEATKVRELREADGGRGRFEDRYLETNHKAHLLHHNKFLIFSGLDSSIRRMRSLMDRARNDAFGEGVA